VAYPKTRRGSNSNFSNFFENVTVDIGNGNPGAAGLRWNGSNYGGVRNVTIRSSQGDGYAGLLYDRKHGAGYHRDITVEGFRKGLVVSGANATQFAMEYVSFLGQQECAIEIDQGSRLSVRKLVAKTASAAIVVKAGFLVLLDSELEPGAEPPAVSIAGKATLPSGLATVAHGFIRNIKVSGSDIAVAVGDTKVVSGPRVEEYVSGKVETLTEGAPKRSLNLPIREFPRPPRIDDLTQWANVDDYGAHGDGSQQWQANHLVSEDRICDQRDCGPSGVCSAVVFHAQSCRAHVTVGSGYVPAKRVLRDAALDSEK
jgi:hypothetical protein